MLTLRRYGNSTQLPLVMIHGFLCAGSFFAPNISEIQDHQEIITVDLPGFGESSNIKSEKSIRGMALRVLETLEIHQIEHFQLLGHSMGGMVALQIALLAPEKITTLFPYATYCSGNLSERFETFEQSKIRFQKTGMEKARLETVATWFVQGNKHPFFRLCWEASKKISLATVLNALDAMQNFSVCEEVKSMSCPTHIFAAEFDRTYALSRILQLNNRIPNSTLTIFKGCSHNAHLENPLLFNQTLVQILKTRKT